MKDGTPTILCNKGTRVVLRSALFPQSMQNSRATEHPAGHVTLCSAAWQLAAAIVVATRPAAWGIITWW
jgi:hypothetical protein